MKRNVKVLIWMMLGIVAVFVIISERKKVTNRIDNAVVIEGIITNKGKRAKGEKYVAYTFFVQGRQYYGSTDIRFCNECKDACCQIGGKVKVRYENGNPANNDLIH